MFASNPHLFLEGGGKDVSLQADWNTWSIIWHGHIKHHQA